jgi:hypothetical protein
MGVFSWRQDNPSRPWGKGERRDEAQQCPSTPSQRLRTSAARILEGQFNRRSQRLWDFCNGRHFFESRHSREPIFCFDVTLQQQGAHLMHNSTLIVLVILTLGQMLMMAFGAFILWLMGDLGSEPLPKRSDGSSRHTGNNLVHVPQDAVKLVEESELINSGEEGSIAPKPAEAQAENDVEHRHGRAAGKAA